MGQADVGAIRHNNNGFFFDLYDRMIGDPDIPSVLKNVADVLCQNLDAERATVYLINKETDELESVALIGNVAKRIRIPIQKSSLAGFCAKTCQSIRIVDAYGDLSTVDPDLCFDKTWDKLNNFRTRDVMCAPACFKKELLGVVQVLNHKGRPFDGENLQYLESISRLIGYTLYHARLLDDMATLKQLEVEKAKFMRVMIHELKSPVAGAKMLADSYGMIHTDNPQTVELSTKIAGRMDQMTQLIQDLLELATVKSGRPMGDITVLDLADEVRKNLDAYLQMAQQKGLALKINVPDDPLHIRFDVQGIRLVLSNLLSNALKYTMKGDVQVTLKRERDFAVLSVRDSGIGIPEKDIPNLFKEFFRASNAKKARITGSGVGLAGIKTIVERFQGRLELKTTETVGSTFTVFLPLHAEK